MKRNKKNECRFKELPSKKLFCVTHQQALLYAYGLPDGYRLICQVGEDIKAKKASQSVDAYP